MDPTLDGELAPIHHHRTLGFSRATTTPLRFVSSSMSRGSKPRDTDDDADDPSFLHPTTAPRFMVPPLSSPSTASWSTTTGRGMAKHRDPSMDATTTAASSASPMASLQAELRGAAEEGTTAASAARTPFFAATEEIDVDTERNAGTKSGSSDDRTTSKHPSPLDSGSPLPCPGFLADDDDVAAARRARSTDPPLTEAANSPRHGRRGPSEPSHHLQYATPSRAAAQTSTGGRNESYAQQSFLAADDMAFARGDTSSAPYVPASIFPTPAAAITPQRTTTTTASTSRTPAASSFASPQPAANNVTPQRRSAAQTAGGFTTAAHVKDLAQKYFTILRQVQHEDSPVTAAGTPSGHPAHQNDGGAGEPRPQHHEQQQHPQHHLISRVFEVRSDAMRGDAAAWADKECYLHRATTAPSDVATKLSMDDTAAPAVDDTASEASVATEPPSLVMTCAPEVSMLVNMGDVALCRLIDVRTRYTMEQEAYTQFLHATTATSLVLPAHMELTAPSKHALRRFLTAHHDDARDAGAAGVDTDDGGDNDTAAADVSAEAFSEVVRRLTTLLAPAGEASTMPSGVDTAAADAPSTSDKDDVPRFLQQLHDDAKHLLPPIRASLFKILSTLADEGTQSMSTRLPTAGDDASASASGTFSMDVAMQDIALQQQNEEAYKQAGNLTHGAAARRELLHMIHGAVQRCVNDMTRSMGDGLPMVEAQRSSDALLATESQRIRACLARTRQQEEAREQRRAALQAVLTATAERRTAIVEAHHEFLAANEADVLATLRKIDELHGTLEQLIHVRSAKVKSFAKDIGSAALATIGAEETYKQHTAKAATVQSTMPDVAEIIAVKVPSVVSTMRAACARRLAFTHVASQSHVATLQQNALQLASMLRHSVSQWVDVLLRNQQRETERVAALQAQIKDAMSRYHQEDVDLFRGQLDEALTRRKKCETEIERLEAMVRSDERTLAKLIPDFTQPHGAAGATSRPSSSNSAYVFTSPGATPRPASGRLGHLPPVQSPAPAAAHRMPGGNHRHEQQDNHHRQTPTAAPTLSSLRTPLKQQISPPSPLHEFVQSPVPAPSSSAHRRRGTQPYHTADIRSPPPQPPGLPHATCLVLVDADDAEDRGGISSTPPPPPSQRRARAVSRPRDDDDNDDPAADINSSRFTNHVVHDCCSEDDAVVSLPGEYDVGHHASVRRARGRHHEADDGSGTPAGFEERSPLPHRPSAWHSGGCNDDDAYDEGHDGDDYGEEPETELVDIDQLTVEEAVSLFRRSAAMTQKWILLLEEADVELMRDVRDMRMSASVWSGFLTHHPLLKSMLETLLDNPTHFMSVGTQ